jgi:hypothetical protein
VIHHGDCVEVMATLEPDSIDAIVTDPPYDLVSVTRRFGGQNARNTPAMETETGSVWARKARGFMGKTWDGTGVAFRPETWELALRVAKPGAYLLAFGGTRTYHRLAAAIEDAGWEIRDTLVWAYASGFPKSLDVSKAIDKAAGAERTVVGTRQPLGREGRTSYTAATSPTYMEGGDFGVSLGGVPVTAPATPDAEKWAGWGTALKPAWEPIVMARKPLVGTVAANVLRYGTGALNIDATRIGFEGGVTRHTASAGVHRDRWLRQSRDWRGHRQWRPLARQRHPHRPDLRWRRGGRRRRRRAGGRRQSSASSHRGPATYGAYAQGQETGLSPVDTSGTYSRFFLIPKADRADREPVLGGLPVVRGGAETMDPRVRDGSGDARMPMRR